jgi:hypothetical protein
VKSLTIAIMQPYFIPYLGYFRLIAKSDLFVIYDCVQFPRRGWVHRNRVVNRSGAPRWLTLPLEYATQDVLIRDLRFPTRVSEIFADRLRSFPLHSEEPEVKRFLEVLYDIKGRPVDYIEKLIKETAGYLGLSWNTIRSSGMRIPSSLRGQDRILAIAKGLGASTYLNAPGGRDLYDADAFARAGIGLEFLPEYDGPKCSVLTRILCDDRKLLAAELR